MKAKETSKEYKIDYELYTVDELVKIIKFFQLIEKTKTKRVAKEEIINGYNEYRNILKNKALEKEYDRMLFEKSHVSIYDVMKNVL